MNRERGWAGNSWDVRAINAESALRWEQKQRAIAEDALAAFAVARNDLFILLDALSTQWLTPEQSKAFDRLNNLLDICAYARIVSGGGA